MKKLLLLLLLCAFSNLNSLRAQSVYHIESEYVVPTGMQYHFDKIDVQTGTSVRIATMPIKGFYTGYAFFNCFGNYVFQGIDSVTPNGNYINKLYEVDTLGNIIRTLPMDTTYGTWYKMAMPAAAAPYYYAFRWNPTAQHYQMECINALTGSRTIQSFPLLDWYSFIGSDFTITRNDVVWWGMRDQMTSFEILLSYNPAGNVLGFEDTLNGNYFYQALNYDCSTDTIYGFCSSQDTINGSELFKVHGVSGTVIHTGDTAIGNGVFTAGTYTRLPDNSFYMKGSSESYLLPSFNVTSPTFTLPQVPSSVLPVFCFAAPREVCSFYGHCEEVSGTTEQQSDISFAAYPNPVTNGELIVQRAGVFTYELTDISGRVVASGNANGSVSIPVYMLASGSYIIRIQQDEMSGAQKVLIRN